MTKQVQLHSWTPTDRDSVLIKYVFIEKDTKQKNRPKHGCLYLFHYNLGVRDKCFSRYIWVYFLDYLE